MADHPQVPVGLKSDVILTLPKGGSQGVTSELVFQGPLEPPIASGDKVGELVLTLSDQKTKMIYPVYAQTTVAKAGFLRRLPIIVQYLLFGKNAQ